MRARSFWLSQLPLSCRTCEFAVRTLMILVEYDGTDFFGWQRQEGVPTIQGALEEALSGILGETVRIEGSGRTDRGVHALAHPASFTTRSRLPLERIRLGCNAKLPEAIALKEVLEVPPGFHARHHAVSKIYRYTLHNGSSRSPLRGRFAAYEPRPLVVAAMHHAGQHLVGRHDFFSLATHARLKESTVRTIHWLTVRRRSADPDVVELDVCGDGFLYNQVRTLAGTLVEVGLGQRLPREVAALVQTRDRTMAGANLPPHGLCLVAVQYPEAWLK